MHSPSEKQREIMIDISPKIRLPCTKQICICRYATKKVILIFFLFLLDILTFSVFYIEIKFLTVVCSILYFYSPLSSLYEPNSIFTPFILCINIYISFKIYIQGNSLSLAKIYLIRWGPQ